MSNSCFWVLGRGASIANGLEWAVSRDWYDDLTASRITGEDLIERIKVCLMEAMNTATVRNELYHRFVADLANRTANGWYHRFLTTNWDTLLERELYPYVNALGVVPWWLGMESHIFHLNGSIEPHVDGGSPFLLEIDPVGQRVESREVTMAFNKLIWTKHVVMVGLSFTCETDQTFLYALNRIEDYVPIGEAKVYIVNPDPSALADVSERVQMALPASEVVAIEEGFDTFVLGGLTPLVGTVLSSSS